MTAEGGALHVARARQVTGLGKNPACARHRRVDPYWTGVALHNRGMFGKQKG